MKPSRNGNLLYKRSSTLRTKSKSNNNNVTDDFDDEMSDVG